MMRNYMLTNSQDLVNNSEYVASYVTYTSQDRDKHRINVEIVKTNPIASVVVLNERNELVVLPTFQPAVGKWFYEVPFRAFSNREHVLQVAEEIVKAQTDLNLEDSVLLTQGLNKKKKKTDTNMQVVFGRVQTFLNTPSDEVRFVNLKEAYYRLKCQIKYNKPFMDGLYLGGLSSNALLLYKFVEE